MIEANAGIYTVFVLNVTVVSLPLILALDPLLFVLYTTPLSTLIFPVSLDHHLYAELLMILDSYHSVDLTINPSITHFQNPLQPISSWMTASLLTFNLSKTEFLFIRLQQQLAKISACSLDIAHSTRISTNIICLSKSGDIISFISFFQILALSKSCHTISHIHQLCWVCPYHDHKTASTIATTIVHSKLDYCNSLYYDLPNTQLNRLNTSRMSLHVPSSVPKIFPCQPCFQIFTLA